MDDKPFPKYLTFGSSGIYTMWRLCQHNWLKRNIYHAAFVPAYLAQGNLCYVAFMAFVPTLLAQTDCAFVVSNKNVAILLV